MPISRRRSIDSRDMAGDAGRRGSLGQRMEGQGIFACFFSFLRAKGKERQQQAGCDTDGSADPVHPVITGETTGDFYDAFDQTAV